MQKTMNRSVAFSAVFFTMLIAYLGWMACVVPPPASAEDHAKDMLVVFGQPDEPVKLAAIQTVTLPPGHTGTINIGWVNNGAPQRPIGSYHFQGSGRGVTFIDCTSWDGSTINIKRSPNITSFSDCTINGGWDRGSNLGEQNLSKVLVPGFVVRCERCDFNSPAPRTASSIAASIGETQSLTRAGGDPFAVLNARILEESPGGARLAAADLPIRAKWMLFGYNVDLELIDCTINGHELVEHDVYIHGTAGNGPRLTRVTFNGSGSQGFKIRSDATETAYAGPNVRAILTGCVFKNICADWNWRGPGAIVGEGSAAHWLIDGCVFTAAPGTDIVPDNLRSRCIDIASVGLSYDIDTGSTTTGSGNGYVVVRNCAFVGKSEVTWNNNLVRVGRNGGAQYAAKGVLIESSGLWGPLMRVSLTDVRPGWTLVRGKNTSIDGRCNTADLASKWARVLKMDVSAEAMIPTATKLIPVSEGWIK